MHRQFTYTCFVSAAVAQSFLAEAHVLDGILTFDTLVSCEKHVKWNRTSSYVPGFHVSGGANVQVTNGSDQVDQEVRLGQVSLFTDLTAQLTS